MILFSESSKLTFERVNMEEKMSLGAHSQRFSKDKRKVPDRHDF